MSTDEFFARRIENIKKHVRLIQVIRDQGLLPYNNSGEDFQMACPFHGKDNHPSAHVYEGDRFHCFRCHVSYDVISFFAEREGLNLNNALYKLEIQYKIPRLVEQAHEKIEILDKKKEIPFADHWRFVEKKMIQKKQSYGLEKYAKLLYALDEAARTEDRELLAKIEGKM